MENTQKTSWINRARPNAIWILFVTLGWYMVIASFAMIPYEGIMAAIKDSVSPAMFFTLDLYGGTIVTIVVLFILTWCFVKNRYIWKSFLLPGKRRELKPGDILAEEDVYAELYGRSRNSFRMLGIGVLLGFLTNFFCIACALLHGDIKLYFDCAASQIPYFLFSLFCVCIQSSSEEMWCRGFLYERLHERYPLWVSVVINGVLFGFLHIFNPGVGVIPILGIIICGLSYSLLRWYTGNIWIAMGIHTGWNFTQNFLFGLPNSGLVSEASVFHLDAANAMSSWVYDWDFGVEGGVPALFIDGLIAVVIIYMACKSGRIRELGMNRIQTIEATMGLKKRVITPVNNVPAEPQQPQTEPAPQAESDLQTESDSQAE